MVLRERPTLKMWRARSRSQNESGRAVRMPQEQMLRNVERNWKARRMDFHVQNVPEDSHHVCSFMWADNLWIMSHKKGKAEQVRKEVESWDMKSKPGSLWWTSTYVKEEGHHDGNGGWEAKTTVCR